MFQEKSVRLSKLPTLEVKGEELHKEQQAWSGSLEVQGVPFAHLQKTAAMPGLGGHTGNLIVGLDGWGR